MRRAASLLAMLVFAALAPGCGGAETTDEELVRAALRRTARVARSFTYEEKRGTESIRVTGEIEDDYRYHALVLLRGKPHVEEVVRDDADAWRFLDESLAPPAATPAGGLPPGPVVTVQSGDPVNDALRSRRWVLDPVGAPDLIGASAVKRPLGADPILDAIDGLAHAETAVAEAASVRLFNEQDPEYRKRDDRFPRARKDSGVKRYDVRPPTVPRVRSLGGNIPPGERHFRRMSVYIKNDRVVRVLELVDVDFRLDDIKDKLGITLPGDLPQTRIVEAAREQLNRRIRAQGGEPLRHRLMSYVVADQGTDVTVELPIDAVEGSLSAIPFRGRSRSRVAPAGP